MATSDENCEGIRKTYRETFGSAEARRLERSTFNLNVGRWWMYMASAELVADKFDLIVSNPDNGTWHALEQHFEAEED